MGELAMDDDDAFNPPASRAVERKLRSGGEDSFGGRCGLSSCWSR